MKNKVRAQNAPKIARVYIRVSYVGDRGKGPGKGEFISHDMQLAEAQKYVDVFLKGYTLDVEASIRHADIDKSASRMVWRKRQGLVEHLEAAQRGEFDAFIVFKLSRLARNVKEGLEIFDLFEEAGCSMHCVKEQIDTSTPLGRLARVVMFGVSEMEAENISEFARATARTRAQKGLLHGSPPFWISKDENGKYVTNERAADIRRLVELKLQGVSYVKTARTLNSEGIRTSEGRRWTTVSVRKYLRPHGLSLLQGHYIFGPDKDDDDPGRIVIPNSYPAVITEDEAEILMAAHRELQQMYEGNPGKASDTTYVLPGKLRCATCGGPLRSRTSYPKGKTPKFSYKCRFASESNLPHPDGAYVSASMLEDAVMRVVLLALLDYKQQYESAPPLNAESKNNGTAMQKKIDKLTDQITRLMDDYYIYTCSEPRISNLDTMPLSKSVSVSAASNKRATQPTPAARGERSSKGYRFAKARL